MTAKVLKHNNNKIEHYYYVAWIFPPQTDSWLKLINPLRDKLIGNYNDRRYNDMQIIFNDV